MERVDILNNRPQGLGIPVALRHVANSLELREGTLVGNNIAPDGRAANIVSRHLPRPAALRARVWSCITHTLPARAGNGWWCDFLASNSSRLLGSKSTLPRSARKLRSPRHGCKLHLSAWHLRHHA